MSQRKRLRSSYEAVNAEAKKALSISYAPAPVIKGNKTTTIDDEKIYLSSDPPGKNYKDSMLTMFDITNMICPVLKYKISHYGFNFAGNHKYQNIPGLITPSYGEQFSDIYSDSRRFTTYDLTQQMAADTIAWTGGTQAWFEAVSLPGTWNCTGRLTQEDKFKAQPSVQGLINGGYSAHEHNYSDFSNITSTSRDFTINYSGGSQTHTFVNQNEHEVYYEIWELAPRDIIDHWIIPEGADANDNTAFRNIHQMCALEYQHLQRPPNANTSNQSAVNDEGTYDSHLGDNTFAYVNADGQQLRHKNQTGFRIKNSFSDIYHQFKVSQPQRGSIKSGGVLVYTIKHRPFKILNSTWRRYAWGQRTDTNGAIDVSYTAKYPHLVPCASKILVCRFWSEIGQNNNIQDTYELTSFKMNWKDVAHVQGRMLHTVRDSHRIRCVPLYKSHQTIEKSFLMGDYASTSLQSQWKTLNDETNTQQTTFDQ